MHYTGGSAKVSLSHPQQQGAQPFQPSRSVCVFACAWPRIGCVISNPRARRETKAFFFSADLFATGVRWSLCRKERLHLHAVFCEVSVLYARVQSCSSLVRGKLATGKALAEQALVAFNTGGAGEGKPKETGTEDSGGREGEQGGPTGSEGRNGCRMLQAATVEAQHGPGIERGGERTGRPRDSSSYQP